MLSRTICKTFQLITCKRLYVSQYVGKGTPCLGIRRETINAWERRAPLAPQHVKRLTKKGVKVLIQPSNRRVFPIQEYASAGATVQEDLSEAQLIISVKQVPIEQLIADKTYAFFSHTIKAQPDNMEMLDTILHRRIRLIDYEKIVDAQGRRLVMFGRWAGYAGFIDILHGLGLRLLALGHHTPFLHIGLAHNYRDSHMAINALRDAGYEIALNNMPRSLGPLVFVFTGTGNVSQGAQQLFEHLPHEYVDVSTLPMVSQKGQLNKVYGCVVGRHDHLVHKNGGPFDPNEFKEHPERFLSRFATEIAPYASVIINGVYWDADAARLITIPDAKHLLTPKARSPEVPGCPTLPHRLIALCDISADPGGSIEFMRECTTIDKPFTIYDADFHQCSDSFAAPSGCLVCSIDNMPAQMPYEATEAFGNLLYPYIIDMLNCSTDQPFDHLHCSEDIKRAIITNAGSLTPRYEYITELRLKSFSAHKCRVMGDSKKHVLLLGAGMVSDPVAHYYSTKKDVTLTVATESTGDGQRLATFGENIVSTVIDISRESAQLEQLIREHDLCISLLPYALHPLVAKLCIKSHVNMTTSSYIAPELQSLDQQAKEANVTVMNEAGLDPGIDHMLAMQCFDQISDHGGKVTSFVSFCGGLPAPESSDNPLRYKFSWSPKGVLMALMNGARYLDNERLIEVEGDCAVLDNLYPICFMPGFNLIGYPNRDSIKYATIYGLGPECKTLLRGTLRYKGFVEAVKALKELGLMNMEPNAIFNSATGPDLSWKQILASLLHQPTDIFAESLKKIAAEKLGKEKSIEMNAIVELGLLSEDVVERHGTALDTLAAYLARKLALHKSERDLVILNHDVDAQLPGGMQERHRIQLVAYGQPNGFSAMASTVGYTTAIISHMLLNGEIQDKGMVRPTSKHVYRPALQRLKDYGIEATETITAL
ncbi:unnamed protein product [Toxocara canis]|uniref:Saccharopine dehydrogenase n=1 Tax=Toxocara canis TaxID=6265 RepID=A0A183UH89_TOXCA|nr:unnamed protein product [Toxocara canis]